MNENDEVKTVSHVILQCFSDSTLHALPKLGKSYNHFILKIIWFICLVACSGYCFYSCVTTFQNYYTYPSSTKISIVEEIPTDFPTISFCNIKILNRSNPKTREYVKMNSEVQNANTLYRVRFAFANDRSLSIEDRRDLGFKIEDMLVPDVPHYFCYFNNDYCFPHDFTHFYNPAYGNCYSFNIGYFTNGTKYEIKQSSIVDKQYGLQLELFLGDPLIDSEQENSDGIVVSIHNKSVEPFFEGAHLLIPPSSESDIIINRNFVSKLPLPHGDCLEDTSGNSKFSSPYFDYIVKILKVNYTQQYCQSFCLQNQTINYCGCANAYLAVFLNTTVFCHYDNETEWDCVWEVVVKYGEEFDAECKKSCPFQCFSIEYTTTISSALYPTPFRLREILELYNYKYLFKDIQYANQAFLKVNFLYQNMQYTTTTQVAQMQQFDLLSKFGGTLGLFLGIYLVENLSVRII